MVAIGEVTERWGRTTQTDPGFCSLRRAGAADGAILARYGTGVSVFICLSVGPHPREVLLGDNRGEIHLLRIEGGARGE